MLRAESSHSFCQSSAISNPITIVLLASGFFFSSSSINVSHPIAECNAINCSSRTLWSNRLSIRPAPNSDNPDWPDSRRLQEIMSHDAGLSICNIPQCGRTNNTMPSPFSSNRSQSCTSTYFVFSDLGEGMFHTESNYQFS